MNSCKEEVSDKEPLGGSKDVLAATVGDFGRWQLKISSLMALVKFPIAWFQMSIVFLAPPLSFWCQKSNSFLNLTDVEWQKLTQPNDQSLKQVGVSTGFCYMRNMSDVNKGLMPCPAFSYDQSTFSSTITTEWDLVCERQKLMDLSQVTLMMGVLLGNILFGVLADEKGRRTVLVFCLFTQAFFGLTASYSPSFWLFIILRFCLALANGGTMVTSFVLCMEVVGGKYRTIVPILYQIPFAFGNALLAGLAFYLRSWRTLHLAISCLSMVYVAMYWLIPESPRWLLTVGRHKDAVAVLREAAKENRVKDLDIDGSIKALTNSKIKVNNSLRDLFATSGLRTRSMLLFINWSLAGVTFFAFLQCAGNISKNLFLAVALGSFSSLPGTILCVFLVSRYGRKTTIASSFLLTSICSLLILAFPRGLYSLDWPRMTLMALGIGGLSVSLPAMYLFTGELFPTTIRNSGVGMSMMFTRLGSMVAPLVVSLQGFLPPLLIGLMMLVQVGLVLPLQETHGRRLPDTIADLDRRNFAHEVNRAYGEKAKAVSKPVTTPKDIVVY